MEKEQDTNTTRYLCDPNSALKIETSKDIYCCVCYEEKQYLTVQQGEPPLPLNDIEPTMFKEGNIPNDILVRSCCGVHNICISCMRKIINNYENHPINDNNSHFACPYPNEQCATTIGFRNVFDHNLIEKICTSSEEWTRYNAHAQRYAFPGHTIVRCPCYYYTGSYSTRVQCGHPILVPNEEISNTSVGQLVIECTQNEDCLKRFCYYCKTDVGLIATTCFDCKLKEENENPNMYNYHFNKCENTPIEVSMFDSDVDQHPKNYDEDSYLYKNGDITVDIAVSQIEGVIQDIHSYMICPICKASLYKTEKCNGLSHHGLERCYSCGRIGFTIRGLGDHWSAAGVQGCFRFDSDSFVQTYVPNFQCCEIVCSNHDKGDCQVEDHQPGIVALQSIRKKAYVLHMLLSLLPSIRYEVYDTLYSKHQHVPTFLEYLPYKQTFVMVDAHKTRVRDYTEDVIYNQLGCVHPQNISKFSIQKNVTIPATEYAETFTNKNWGTSFLFDTKSTNTTIVSAWRRARYISGIDDIRRNYTQIVENSLQITEPDSDQDQDNNETSLLNTYAPLQDLEEESREE